MSDAPHEIEEPGAVRPAVKRPGRRPWQVGLRTLVLLVVAAAVWIAFFLNRRQNAWLESRIATMRPLAHELSVDDPKKVAVVKLEETWYDENRWDLYLPTRHYRVCLATRGIDQNGFAPAVKSGPLAAGRHQIVVEQQRVPDGWRVVATWDGTGRLAVDEPKGWDDGSGSMGGGQFAISEQLAAARPVVLFRRRFTRRDAQGRGITPDGPTEGVLLWIERVAGSDAGP